MSLVLLLSFCNTENEAMKDHHLMMKKNLSLYSQKKHLGIWDRMKFSFPVSLDIVILTKWKRCV